MGKQLANYQNSYVFNHLDFVPVSLPPWHTDLYVHRSHDCGVQVASGTGGSFGLTVVTCPCPRAQRNINAEP